MASHIAFGQVNTTACGGGFSGTGGSLTYSAGQVDYITNNGLSGIITQGLQQPFEIFKIDINNVNTYNTEINAVLFPNPSNGVVNLRVSDYVLDNLSYHLFDLQGKLITEAKLISGITSINLENISDGNYYLNIQKEGQILKNFKLIKH